MAKRVDANQPDIVCGLRAAGYLVYDLHTVGRGVPDLLVLSKAHQWVLIEIKAPGGRMTKAEAEFFETTQGAPRCVAVSISQALEFMSRFDEVG